MPKRFMILAIALAAGLGLGQAARAGMVTFDDRVYQPDPILHLFGEEPFANGFDEQGLHFFTGQSFIVPAQLDGEPGIFPTAFTSNFWQASGEDVVITRTGGGTCDFGSLSLGHGVGLDDEPGADTIHVSWTKGPDCLAGCTGSQDIAVGLGFSPQVFGLADLSSITFSSPNVVRFLAFDDIATSAPVPEPSAWTLLILGFGAMGAAMRRGRRRAAA
jgi:hypothetical protein